MKIVVLGAGVIGVTTAYYLAKAGHQVEVIDRQKGPALETSFANAGEISPGYASPWAGPGIPQKAVKWLLMKHPPLIVRPVVDPYMARWLLQMLGNCTAGRYAINKSRMVRVAEYSRDVLKALRADTGISYDDRALGTLQLFRTERQLKAAKKDIEVLAEYGVPYELLDKSGCIAAEPGLAASKADIAGGLLLRNDETGDCFQFTQKLAAMAEALGVQFHYGTTITDIAVDRGKVTTVLTSKGNFTADAHVLALGSFSPIVARKLGIDLPIYPVKGYSITAPIADERTAPVSTVLDETYKIAITRLGSRIRVGGMAEISGYNSRLPQERRKTLEHCLQDLFPGSGDLAGVSFWSGLRPMTPDSTPIIGRSRLDNLLLNTGHGTLGWTMACGSGRLIADIASGVSPDIDISDLDTTRYQ